MATVEERLAALEAQMAALTARDQAAPVSTEGTFWALDGLKQRVPEGQGGVLYTGTVRLDDERYDWQYGLTVENLLDGDWSELAGALTALAHPVRLRLLREILGGRRSAADLAEIEGLGSSGQVYHHLRQLTSAGWLRTAARGQYAIPPDRIVPLLAILTAAHR